ncbi:MAG: alpha-2-macroglobulin, partial [Dysgonamonadaceae bacterium]|nr:alpha-2-macroglobulin [Dysgonamonadaceae bacterium]
MKKSLYIAVLVILSAILGTFFSCGEQEVPAAEFLPYINAFTEGMIKPNSAIRVELAEVQQNIEPNSEADAGLFAFSPPIKGKAYWIDSRTIEFTPDADALQRGQTYQATFALGKLVKNIDGKLKKFRFSFTVQEKSIEIRSCNIVVTQPDSVSISGEIASNEAIDIETLKNAVSLNPYDKKIAIYFEKTDEQNVVKYFSENIPKKDKDFDLNLEINAKSFGIKQSVTQIITVPARVPFKVLKSEMAGEQGNAVTVCFSEPLSISQDLTGFIDISEIKEFTTSVENNFLTIYFDRDVLFQSSNSAEVHLTIDAGIKNINGKPLEEPYYTTLTVLSMKPQVEILKSGNIIPDGGAFILPFRTVNLKAVDLKVIKIFENNILMFLQNNRLDGSNEIRRSGRLVYSKTLPLDLKTLREYGYWQNYSLDLTKIIRKDPGAVYRVEFSFKQEYSTYPCEKQMVTGEEYANESPRNIALENDENEDAEWDIPNTYYYSSNYDWNLYDWRQTDNPCHPTYYMIDSRKAASNVMISDIGLIAKGASSGQWWISTANILDAKPIKDAEIAFYNFQLQKIGVCKTDENGFATISPNGKPFIAKASYKGHNTYLRLVDGEENSLSRFDIDGKKIEKGLKGFIYGERGVWRPGDTLHLGFILYDVENRIPANHPVTLELYNARGQFAGKFVNNEGTGGVYAFSAPTDATDPTGLWNAYVKVGGATFHKSLRIETVKPNRLKINLSLPEKLIEASAGSIPVKISSSWLTGATAHNLKTKMEVSFSRVNTQFSDYEKYVFNNPASDFATSVDEVFDGALNDSGEASFNLRLPETTNAPGMLNATFTCRVFEQGGDASIFSQTAPYSPYSSYVGVNLNVDPNEIIETDKRHQFQVVTLNSDGKPIDVGGVDVSIYRIGWSWWWENNSESFSNYVNNTSYKPVFKESIKTTNGKGSFDFEIKYPEWGRYFVYVKNPKSGHATGGAVYVDWPSWRGQSQKNDPSGIKVLTFSTDKKSYQAGEEVTVIIPAAAGGKALVALENGSRVIDRAWVDISEKEATKYIFKATRDMAPNFYVHISLLQPYSQTINELPIRMYGVVPVSISDKESVLEPQIKMPEVLRPETQYTVEISEKQGRAMTYTLAVVDEGLLDLTNFKTPDPWKEFNVREALGVRTWDMYDYVMGAYGGKFAGLFSVGGDETLKSPEAKANRFKPVVKFIGPFTLPKGERRKHEITLPSYVGSVRTMVVAAHNGAFGKAEATTPVRTPLMLLSTLPRVLSVNEEISLPINVFAMENTVKDVTVKVETTGLLKPSEGNSKQIKFATPGDRIVYFSMKTGSQTGIEKVTITASGGGKTTKETVEIAVRNPNPPVILSDSKVLEAGQSAVFDKFGNTADAEWVRLEAARIPSFNITNRYDYLYDYSHYCSEQLTSKALPLLYLPSFKEVGKEEKAIIDQNIREAIKNLYGRQLSDGGIAYWTGQSQADLWITSYAGTFLILAKEKGYEVNSGVLKKWKDFQLKQARSWSRNTANNYYSRQSEYVQAYRLYALALAGSPEQGAMNRLKELPDLMLQTRWMLAAAYSLDGKTKPAEELIFNLPTAIDRYYSPYTYGSSTRDEAFILQTLTLLGRTEQAFNQARKIAADLSGQAYYDTQSTAVALTALGDFADKSSGNIDFEWSVNSNRQSAVKTSKAMYVSELQKSKNGIKAELANKSKGSLYVNISARFRPVVDTLQAVAENLKLDVSYTDMNGAPLNVSSLAQGTDFYAVVKVSNISSSYDYSNLALTQIIPSGWELFSIQNADSGYDYRDIRDDRSLTYFALPRGAAKTFKIRLQTSYLGEFTLPAISCEDMYDISGRART